MTSNNKVLGLFKVHDGCFFCLFFFVAIQLQHLIIAINGSPRAVKPITVAPRNNTSILSVNMQWSREVVLSDFTNQDRGFFHKYDS